MSSTIQTGVVAQPDAVTGRRADALDALRGFAILTMALSGMVPRHELPAWMYHAQLPPPEHAFDPTLPGLTWVDLVFPFFLFSMGAAFPLALRRRLDSGDRWWRIGGYVLRRGLLLAAFAIYVQHINPWLLSPTPGVGVWLIALLGFVILFPSLVRLPADWPRAAVWVVRLLGWIAAAGLLACLRYPDGSGFSIHRSDIIIVVLANTAVFGSFAWLASQRNVPLRFGLMLALVAMRLAHENPGWVRVIWDSSPAPWIYRFYYLQYLLIVLPGTIVGDALLRWLREPDSSAQAQTSWPRWRVLALGLAMVGLHVLVLAGLQGRWLPWTPFVVVLAMVCCAPLVRGPDTATERLLRTLYGWGAMWLTIGLLFEPYEGGIKKDHATLSYYFVTSGLASFALLLFTVLIDCLRQRRPMRILIDNGQNPMLAYVGIRNLLPPVLALTGIESLLSRVLATPWLGALRAMIKTALLAAAVSMFTRLKLVWRT